MDSDGLEAAGKEGRKREAEAGAGEEGDERRIDIKVYDGKGGGAPPMCTENAFMVQLLCAAALCHGRLLAAILHKAQVVFGKASTTTSRPLGSTVAELKQDIAAHTGWCSRVNPAKQC